MNRRLPSPSTAGDAAGPKGLDRQPSATPRSERTRAVMLEAALAVFLRDGYEGASMDEIVALASVSKQTLYKYFGDKQGLFAAAVLAAIQRTHGQLILALQHLEKSTDPSAGLQTYGRELLRALMQPQALRIRRLIIAEANRFPQLGRTYNEETFERAIDRIAHALEQFARVGQLTLEDPVIAAHHLVWLVIGVPRNRVMLCGDDTQISSRELRRYADAGIQTFLAAYLPR